MLHVETWISVFASCSFSEISAEYCLLYFYYMMLDVSLELGSFFFKETKRERKKRKSLINQWLRQ